MKAYFEGEIIDGLNHTFTSSTTSNCDVLDVYFWNRFPSFKEIESIKDTAKEDHLYMRWYEKGKIKQKINIIKKGAKKHSPNPESDQEDLNDEDFSDEEDEIEVIDYIDDKDDEV
mmetsp:Transcript_14857/g.14440  ORF Transcript_14857/g.14440 Transcript_14857/m.14440 type:complete len:115 (+) Transcript_14857:199-543(+)